jgi:uncharacterized protein YbjT (DUF2867 family)
MQSLYRESSYTRPALQTPATHVNLRVVEGDLADAAAIGRAVDGADAVISALGPTLKRNATGAPVTEELATSSTPCKTPASAATSASPHPPSPT